VTRNLTENLTGNLMDDSAVFRMCKRGLENPSLISQWGPGSRTSLSRVWRQSQMLKVAVNECLNFDVLEFSLVKWQKIPSSKLWSAEGGRHKGPLNTPLEDTEKKSR